MNTQRVHLYQQKQVLVVFSLRDTWWNSVYDICNTTIALMLIEILVLNEKLMKIKNLDHLGERKFWAIRKYF